MAVPVWQLLIGKLLVGNLLALAAPLWQLLISKLFSGVLDDILSSVFEFFLVCDGDEDLDGGGVGAIHDLRLSRT